MVSLALAQNDPGVALELLSTVARPSAIDRSLKLMTLAQLDRPEEAVALLRSITSAPNTVQRIPKIYEEVVSLTN